jgi:prepilin-type N-terminal cleavage/methylation domain-containing protein
MMGQAYRARVSRGFTVIETLVALAVFAGVFAVLYGGLTGNWRGVGRVQMDALALSLAQTQFALAGREAVLQDGQTWAGSEGGVSWTVAVEAYRDSDPSQLSEGTGAYWIIFDARWGDGAALEPKSMRMRTLKLEAAR